MIENALTEAQFNQLMELILSNLVRFKHKAALGICLSSHTLFYGPFVLADLYSDESPAQVDSNVFLRSLYLTLERYRLRTSITAALTW
jgi:hypothetical protein